MKTFAFCCGKKLSEWFISKGPEGWGMQCFFCKRVSRYLDHDSFREAIKQ